MNNMIHMRKKLLVILVLSTLLLCSCANDSNDKLTSPQIPHFEGHLHIVINEDSAVEVGRPLHFYIVNDTEDLILFPRDQNLKLTYFDEEEKIWREGEFDMPDIESPDEYIGIQPGDYLSTSFTPTLGRIKKPVKVMIYVSGWVYRGDLTKFDENGLVSQYSTTLTLTLSASKK
jgi:hypothetical protein